jgi:hypothetical protein
MMLEGMERLVCELTPDYLKELARALGQTACRRIRPDIALGLPVHKLQVQI